MLPLIDKDLEQIIPKLYETEREENKTVYARFYLHDSQWFVLEYSSLQRLCFGLIDVDEKEYGYFSLDELELIGAIRDYEFVPKLLKEGNYGKRVA